MQDLGTAPVLEFPPTALQGISTAIIFTDPDIIDQIAWTASVSGQQWGNGVYELRVSSGYTAYQEYHQMWQIFDKVVQFHPHFELYHYSTSTAEYTFGIKAGYTLDQQYYGKPWLLSLSLVNSCPENTPSWVQIGFLLHYSADC